MPHSTAAASTATFAFRLSHRASSRFPASHRVLSLLFPCLLAAGCLCNGLPNRAAAAEPLPLLRLAGEITDPEKIDYSTLPELETTLSVVSPAEKMAGEVPEQFDMHHLQFQLHSYLARFNGRFWCIWSYGPPIEDEPTQEVRYATSTDGITWSESKPVTGTPEAPYAWIARSLWIRNGELLALAAHYRGKGAFGANKELELRAFAWNEEQGTWQPRGKLYDDAINNFPPQLMESGEWIVTRRDARFNVSILVGGKKSLTDWQAFPVVGRLEVKGFIPDEPILWPLPEGKWSALYRDNSGTRRLFHSVSSDGGRTWTLPARTNFPNATSKLFSMQTSSGVRVLVSNANPGLGRRELHLSLSRDGQTFTRMAKLKVPSPPAVQGLERLKQKFRAEIASLQYPHVIEHEGQLLIAISRGKKQIEVLRLPLASVDALLAE